MIRVSDYLYQKASVKKVPLSGCFELSPICNFSCKMCYVRKTKEQILSERKELKSWKEWIYLAEQCRKEGTLYLLLTGGEPFIYPKFRELYTELHKMGFLISINSNGTMINTETIKWLKTMAPTRVNITLYGSSSETYERICGHKDGFERAKNAILLLKEAGIPIVINASMIPENADDLESIVHFGKALGIHTRVSTYMFPPIRRNREESDSRFAPDVAAQMNLRRLKCLMDETEYRSMLQKKLHEIEMEESKDTWGYQDEFMNCRAGRSSFWVSWDGTMSACGLTPFPIQTNPFLKSFKLCWMELTNCVRNTAVLKECNTCKKKSVCNPCVAMLYAEVGDVNKKAPYLCKMADCIIENMKLEESKNETRK